VSMWMSVCLSVCVCPCVCMCVGVVCERMYAWVYVCVSVNVCVCGGRCALIYHQNQRKFDKNLWLFMDVLCIVRRILNKICSFLRWCSSFHLVYFSILLLFVQFSPGVCAVFFWCLDSFLHAHTNNKHTRAHKQMHTRAHTRAHSRTQ